MTITPLCQCPTCSYVIDAATCVTDARSPRPKDVSACFKCGELLVFTEDLTVRAMDLNDMMALDEETKAILLKTQKQIRQKRPLDSSPKKEGR